MTAARRPGILAGTMAYTEAIARIESIAWMETTHPPALSSIDRRPGHEVVLAELMGARANGAPRLMMDASRLYTATADDNGDHPAWETLSAGTVRMWVRVAREALAIHGGGR
jgi:hypothetical protein